MKKLIIGVLAISIILTSCGFFETNDNKVIVRKDLENVKTEILKEVKVYIKESVEENASNIISSTFKSTIYFSFDGVDVSDVSKEEIKRVADIMKKYNQLIINVNGFTDSTGDEIYNKKLSSKRAYQIKKMLEDEGISSNRIKAEGHGESDISKEKRLNRRVELTFSFDGD